jgi:hypothetical protein
VNVTTDLESDLKEDLLSCDLGQINAIPNQYGRLLNLFVLMPLQTLGGWDVDLRVASSST